MASKGVVEKNALSGAHFGGAPGWGGPAGSPSLPSPIGFHLPEGRLLRASLGVNHSGQPALRPSGDFITGIPMARARPSNLLGRESEESERESRPESERPACALVQELCAFAPRQDHFVPGGPLPATGCWRSAWHHAARSLCPLAHAPLAAHVGAAAACPLPPHHGPPGKSLPLAAQL